MLQLSNMIAHGGFIILNVIHIHVLNGSSFPLVNCVYIKRWNYVDIYIYIYKWFEFVDNIYELLLLGPPSQQVRGIQVPVKTGLCDENRNTIWFFLIDAFVNLTYDKIRIHKKRELARHILKYSVGYTSQEAVHQATSWQIVSGIFHIRHLRNSFHLLYRSVL